MTRPERQERLSAFLNGSEPMLNLSKRQLLCGSYSLPDGSKQAVFDHNTNMKWGYYDGNWTSIRLSEA